MALLALAVPLWAAAPVLRAVHLAPAASATTLTVDVSSAFAQTAYRPSPELLLVDLHNVSAGPDTRWQQLVKAPGGPLNSYRLYPYRGANGEQVLRLEINLNASARPSVRVAGGELVVRIVADPSAAAAPAAPASTIASTTARSWAHPVARPVASTVASNAASSAASNVRPSPAAIVATQSAKPGSSSPHFAALSAARAITVRAVRLGGTPAAPLIQVETAPAAPTFHVLRLHHPERLAIDLAGSELKTGQRRWAMSNSPLLRDLRAAQFQEHTARLVLDLAAPASASIQPVANGLSIALAPATATAERAQPVPAAAHKLVPASSAQPALTAVHAQPVPTPLRRPIRPAASLVTASAAPVAAAMPAPRWVAAVAPVRQRPASVSAAPRAVATLAVTRPRPVSAPVSPPIAAVPPPTRSVSAPPAAAPVMSARLVRAAAPPSVRASVPPSAPTDAPLAAAVAAAPPPLPPPSLPPAQVATPRGVAPPSLRSPLDAQQGMQAVPYSGERITLNLKDADIKDFFRLIHEISGLNLIVDPSVKGTVTMVMSDVPWDQSLDLVLRNNQLGRELEGNVVRIAPLSVFQAEAEQRAALLKSQEDAAPLTTQVKALSYAKATDLAKTLLQYAGKRGTITPDERTNTLIIQTTADALPLIDQLITRLDQKTPQVEVEARVISTDHNYTRELGVQLGFGAGNRSSAVGGNQSVGVGQTAVAGLNPKYPTVGTGGGQLPLNINLPVGSPTSGLAFINASNSFRIDAVLSAAEARGLGKILSRPRVITQNNAKAVVQQGVKIPVQTTINNTISVQFFDVTLKMTVTPQITADNTVFLQVDVENDQLDPGIPRIQGVPAIDTQEATTNVLVRDGATVVIGGVMVNNDLDNVSKVPALGSVPVLGNLFKHTSKSRSSQELLFFLTPHIVRS